MSKHEKMAWASLAATLLVWSFLTMRMTEGAAIVEVSVRHMVWTYAAVIVLMSVAHGVIAGAFAARDGETAFKDERDRAIEARADRIEGYVVAVAINVLVIHLLASASFPGNVFPAFTPGSLPALVYVLLSVLFVAHAAGRVATIWQYRA